MRNAGLEEAQAGIMIARRNINNLRYADDTTLMAESEGEGEGEVTQSCPTLRPHGLQPTRFLHPWDFPRHGYWSGVPLLIYMLIYL